MAIVSMRQMLEAGVHFGHQTHRWNPRMKRFIFGERNGIYIIDLEQTLDRVDTAYKYVRDMVANGGTILFIGTKKQAQDPIIQMQQAELQIKKQEADIKALKVKGDLQLKAEELSLKAQESAARTGEDPAMAAMRLQQEIAQAQELHGLEMAAKQMELQQAQAQQQQQMQQQQAQAQQKLAHGGQVHEQKLRHTDLDRIQKLLQGNKE